MKTTIFTLIIACCWGIFTPLFGQDFFRVKVDFTIKEKTAEGTSKLTIGTAYYDKNTNKLIYDIEFPEKTTLIMVDTTMVIIDKENNIERKKMPNSNRFSIFNLALNGQLDNYGLKGTAFTISDVEKSGDLVITTWDPPKQLAEHFGRTIISQKNKALYGVIFFSPQEEITTKQFYRNYTNVFGLSFPQEVIQVVPSEEKDFYKVTTYKNIEVNEMDNEDKYNFDLSTLEQQPVGAK